MFKASQLLKPEPLPMQYFYLLFCAFIVLLWDTETTYKQAIGYIIELQKGSL